MYKFRRFFTRFLAREYERWNMRGGLLSVEVNLGRGSIPKVKYANRKCQLYDINQVDVDSNLLLECPVWASYR